MRTTYLVFRQGYHFIQPILKEGFGHIIILQYDKYNWYKVDASYNTIEFEILPYGGENIKPIQLLIESGYKVLKIEHENKKRKIFSVSCIHMLNCVALSKYILGIKNLCITPYQLYRWLLKHEGKDGLISVKKL